MPAPWQAVFPDLRQRMAGPGTGARSSCPPSGPGGAVFLRFGAVNYHAKVLVNRTLVTEHEGGWLPFEADIGAVLRPGVNEVAVHVTAPTDDPAAYPEYPFSEIPAGKQSWYGPLGGIWQPILLERRALDHIRVRLRRSVRRGGRGDARSLTPAVGPHDLSSDRRSGWPDRRPAALAAGEERARASLLVTDPSTGRPMHRICTSCRRCCGAAARSPTRPGALRLPLDRDPRRSDLPTASRCSCAARSIRTTIPTGSAHRRPRPFEDQFRKAAKPGSTACAATSRCPIRVLRGCRPGRPPDLDRVAQRGPAHRAGALRAEATLHGILERDGNHPSIFCWTIINENWGTDLVHSAEDRAWLRRTVDWLKAADPDRLVVDNSPIAPSFHLRSDLEDFHFLCRDSRTIGAAGTGRRGARRQAGLDLRAARGRATGDEPLLCSEFGNWGLPEPARRGAGDAEPWWFETGQDWGDGAAYPHGIESRFRAAGLERVFGSFSAFVEAAQWQQYRALKYQIETMRRQPALAGYVITEFTDCLWESNGLLDMRRNPRVFHDAFAAINADTVIVPQWERVAYRRADDPCRARGGARRHAAARGVSPMALRRRGGRSRPVRAGRGRPRPAARDFAAPALDNAAVQRLELALRGPAAIATNHLELTILPRRSAAQDGSGRPTSSDDRISLWATSPRPRCSRPM